MDSQSPEDREVQALSKELVTALSSMTEKQQRYLVALAVDPNAKKAPTAKEAGYSLPKKSKPSRIHNSVMKAGARQLGRVLREHGLDEYKLAEKIFDGLDCVEIKPQVKRTFGKGGVVLAEEIVGFEVPDNRTQLGFAKLLVELLGLKPAQRIKMEHSAGVNEEVQQVIDELSPEKLRALASAELPESQYEVVEEEGDDGSVN